MGRETKGEVVLVERLHAALVKLNPTLPTEAVNTAIDELTRDLLLPRPPSGQVSIETLEQLDDLTVFAIRE